MMTDVLFVAWQVILVTAAPMCHLTQDCPEKIPASGRSHHHNRLHSHSHYNCNHIDRSQSFHHRHSQGKGFDRSGLHHWPQCSRSSSHYERHAFHSLSYHGSSLQYPSTNRCSRWHSHQDTLHHHSCNSSTVQHSSCQSHSCDYLTDCSWSSSRHSDDTACKLHTHKALKTYLWKATLHRPLYQR